MKRKNEVGNRYGALIVIQDAPKRENDEAARWLCKCECGKSLVVRGTELRIGRVKSCGCKIHKDTHLLSNTREFKIWQSMKSRCGGTTTNEYILERYVERGITVSDDWVTNFSAFIADMGFAPTSKHTLDRVDNNRGYCKDNCRWATATQQARNRSNNVNIEYNGVTKCITEWANELGVSKSFINHRMPGKNMGEIIIDANILKDHRKLKLSDRVPDRSC